MAYNSYFANVVSRLVVLLGTFIGLAWILVNTSRFFTVFFLSLLAIVQVFALIHYINKTNRDLARFLLLLTEEETTVLAWRDRVENTFRGLHHSFKKVNEEISRIRLEKEKKSILLQNVIDHIQAGIFVSDESGVIELVNQKALSMFEMPSLDMLEDLDRFQKGLASWFSKLRYNSGNILHINSSDGERLPVMVSVSAFRLGEKNLSLYAIQGIQNELEANEIESWQKLTRVLAHEISNSVTPIATLGTGISRKLQQASLNKDGGMRIHGKAAADLLQSSELITLRGNALIEFVDHYKSFARLPDPLVIPVDINSLFEHISAYFKKELKESHISLNIEVQDDIKQFPLDQNLMEQALINLVRNSIFALSGRTDGVISLCGRKHTESELILEVTDNGPGIPDEIQTQVFIPFFTTKPKGTGIGLSIVKKILNMHGGSIRFRALEGRGTTFILKLPQIDPE